jgi:hypothetical protein
VKGDGSNCISNIRQHVDWRRSGNPTPKAKSVVPQPNDQETVLRAIEDARCILGEYIAPGQRDAVRTLERLLIVLDNENVLHALDRMKQRRVLRLVE